MLESDTLRVYPPREELANAITHGVGAVLSLAVLALLVWLAAWHGDVWHVVSCAVFGATLLLLYTASTLYHAIPSPRMKPLLRKIDHASIYLLIAGTYTPFTLVNLRGAWGWTLFGIVWAVAILGAVLRLTGERRRQRLAVAIYVALGWVAVVAVRPMLESIDRGGVILLVLGGLCYTGGVVFYLWRTLPYHHAIWHGFVLAGSLCHVLAVVFYVIPLARLISG